MARMEARIWDALFILLLIAPMITGGLWLHHPGLHLEITEPGIPAVALAIWFWQARRRNLDLPSESFVWKTISFIWSRWREGLERRPAQTLALGCSISATLQFLTSLARHRAFGSGLADLGIFTNAISNVAPMGFPFSSLKNAQSLLADHQEFILYPLGWIFPVWPSPVFLLLLQAALFSTGAAGLYLLGRQRLGQSHTLIAWLPVLYWLCGPLRNAVRFDAHPEILMMPAFLFTIYFLQEAAWSKRIIGIAFFLTALACKESAGPVACGLGLAWLFGSGPLRTRSFTRPLGLLFLVIGGLAFYADSRLVPSLLGVTYTYTDLYAPLGPSPLALALSPFTQPLEFFRRLVTISRLKFLLGTLLPLGFAPLAAPAALVASLPGFLMLFLTAGDHRISLGYHYSIEPMIGLFFALPAALEKLSGSRWKNAVTPALVLGALLSFGRSDPYFWRIYRASPHLAWVRDEVIPRIPRARSVTASYGFVPHLAVRRWVNQIPFYLDDQNRPVDCGLVDESVNNTPLGAFDMQRARAIFQVQEYSEELRCGTFSLYRRPGGESCLSSQPAQCPGSN